MSLVSHVVEAYRVVVLVTSVPGAEETVFPFCFLVQAVEQLLLGCGSAWGIGMLPSLCLRTILKAKRRVYTRAIQNGLVHT